MSAEQQRPTIWRSIFILLPLVLYPVVDFILRIANGIIAPSLSTEFSLNAADLGLVSSVFFIAFGLSQLPLGVALDRFGPRLTTACLLATAICGVLIFIFSNSIVGLVAGRILLGIGMSASLIAGIKTASIWLPGRLPIVTSILVGSTGIGGMIATVPFTELLNQLPWRTAFIGLSATIGILFVASLVLIPASPPQRQTGIGEQFKSFGNVFRSLGLWRLAPLTMTCVGVGSAYQTLWAPLWLRDVAGFAPEKIAWVLLSMMGVYALGNISFGWVAQRIQRAGHSSIPLILITTMLFIFCQVILAFAVVEFAVLLWVSASLLLAGAYATYSVVTANFPSEYAARASSTLNFLVFVSVFAIQWLTGLIIGSFSDGSQGTFAPHAYSWAMAVGIGLQLLGIGWYFLIGRRN